MPSSVAHPSTIRAGRTKNHGSHTLGLIKVNTFASPGFYIFHSRAPAVKPQWDRGYRYRLDRCDLLILWLWRKFRLPNAWNGGDNSDFGYQPSITSSSTSSRRRGQRRRPSETCVDYVKKPTSVRSAPK
ncbi:hypothetical protein PDIDSM_1548 [Penicillium digitatum]|nr:hypothetical protein PDIDSM_1548 [Penicillium digitatum]